MHEYDSENSAKLILINIFNISQGLGNQHFKKIYCTLVNIHQIDRYNYL